MPLTLYNTLTRQKDIFAPLDAKNVRVYVCGPTVYDFAHIGNARPVIVFDVLYRLLRRIYGADHVRYVRNITDVDDKINAAAKANNESIRDLTERTAQAFHEDVAALGCLPPDVEPRATEHIPPMIAMIERLIAQGHAYVAEGAHPNPPAQAGEGMGGGKHVLFAVQSDPDYGKLSRRNRDEMIAGARVEVAPYKRDAADFVLWKPSPPDLPGWDSPWGRGRPGWHVECSAMSEAYLGRSFDIHGGGLDLIFPHHENEIAQSECAHDGAPFARYWLHNGFVTVDGAKMAKSEGNFRTIREVLKEAPGEAARLMMIKTHYRQPLDWTSDGLREAKANLDRWYRLLKNSNEVPQEQQHRDPANPTDVAKNVVFALEDDLNTPEVFTAMSDIADEAFRSQRAGQLGEFCHAADELKETGKLLGLLQENPDEWLKGELFWVPTIDTSLPPASRKRRPELDSTIIDPIGPFQSEIRNRIEDLVHQRTAARKARDFALADKIRVQLAMEGIVLEDNPDGTTGWRRA